MINSNITIDSSSINAIQAKVSLYNSSGALVANCTCGDRLQSFTVSRIGENKFFGFGICQKLDIQLIDLERELTLSKGDKVQVGYTQESAHIYPYPEFFIEEVTRDEETNSLTIVAYDQLYQAAAHTFEELELVAPYNAKVIAERIATLLGLYSNQVTIIYANLKPFTTDYPNGANFEGKETLRQVLDAIAEITQTIYYIDVFGALAFKKLDISGNPVLTVTRDDYFTLKTGENVTLEAICHYTELGDNVSTITKGVEGGVTQYVRENPFWTMREDIDTLLNTAMEAVEGLSINQFNCEDWTGNFLLEIGDKIALETEDGSTITTYVLNDVFTYDGITTEATQWTFEPNDNETPSNPTSLGEALNQTYARVDKANRLVEIAIKTANQNSSILMDENGIVNSVSKLNTEINGDDGLKEKVEGLDGSYKTLSQEVSTKLTASDFTVEVKKVLEGDNAVGEIKTKTTGFTFNDEGLSINKSDSPISTTITENGMTVSNNGSDTLVANEAGVKAIDLHATTFLVIGENSRFEENGNRTACFWIGG